MDWKSSVPVVIRYLVSMFGSILVSRGLLDAEQVNTAADQISIIAGAILALAPVAYAIWNRPSRKALEAARQIDEKLPPDETVHIKTPGNRPDIRVVPK